MVLRGVIYMVSAEPVRFVAFLRLYHNMDAFGPASILSLIVAGVSNFRMVRAIYFNSVNGSPDFGADPSRPQCVISETWRVGLVCPTLHYATNNYTNSSISILPYFFIGPSPNPDWICLCPNSGPGANIPQLKISATLVDCTGDPKPGSFVLFLFNWD